jgi:MFS family permease
MLANTCLTLSQSSVNTLVSTYATFLGAGAVLVGALTGMFFGVSFAMRPISGPVTTKMDKRKLIILANVIGIIVNAGYAISGGIGTFVLFRVLKGSSTADRLTEPDDCRRQPAAGEDGLGPWHFRRRQRRRPGCRPLHRHRSA